MSNKKNNNTIRILCTSDVHGKIYPHGYGDGAPLNVGFARLAAKIDELRTENTILIDNGDVLEGSPLQLYHMMTKNAQIISSPATKVLRKIGYDYINTGNHDYNFGVGALLNHFKESGARCLTGNVDYLGRPLSEYGIKPLTGRYELLEICGKKVAVFGLVTHFVTHWESENHINGLSFYDAFDTAKEILKQIKKDGKADYTVCVYHGGFEKNPETGDPIGIDSGENQGYRMLKELSGIDVLLTGHQHRFFQGIWNDKTAYTQTNMDGVNIACVDINVETGKIVPEIIAVDTNPKEEVLGVVKESEEECQVWLDKVIGSTEMDLRIEDEHESRVNKTQLITFINRVQMDYSGAEIGAVPLFNDALGLGPEITMRQIVATYRFPDNLVVKRVTGKTLREYLEKDLEYWTVEYDDDGKGRIAVNPMYLEPYPQAFNYDMLDGVEYTARISNPVGNRIVSLTRNGEKITDDMEFKIVISNYRAAGGGDFFMLSESETVWQDPKNMIEILAEKVMKDEKVSFEPISNITIEV